MRGVLMRTMGAAARGWCGAGLAVLLALAAGLLANASVRAAEGAAVPRTAVGERAATAPDGHVGSRACASCHAPQTQAWAASHHARAMAPATAETVLGDFSNITATHGGSSARFLKDGPRFLVEAEGKDGRPASFEITHTFGLTPLQQYLVAFPDGRMQVLPWAWDARPGAEGGQRWIHVYEQEIRAGDPLHWTGPLQTWNHMCAECHSTALTKGYDPATDTYATRFAEVSVGCESCHGPGAGHVAWARGAPHPDAALKGFASAFARRPPVDFTPAPDTGSPHASAARPAGDEVEMCARCHSRRGLLSEDWQPGRPLLDTHAPAFLSEGLFEADGQMRDEVFNDHLFKQSRMYARGVICTDCHDPHSGRLKAPGAQVCAQCHAPDKFAAPSHTGHPDTAGAPDCISCHMPARTYMRVDRRHDHSFRIPRPDLSARLGTPNTCNACHADRPAEWAAEAIARWHGPARKGFQTYADAFHAARAGDPAAREKLIAIARDGAVPAVARATALDELARFPARATDAALEAGVADADPLVRVAALGALQGREPAVRWRLASPLLEDPVRAVRLAAARMLADVPPARLPEPERKRLAAALAAHETELLLQADRPEGRANLATLRLAQGDRAAAARELRAGLAMEPGASALAVNLADLYRMEGRDAEAEATLRAALARTTDPAPLHHALGLALVRQKRMAQAMAELEAAARLAPENPRFAYVYAVALRSAGEEAATRAVVAEALARHPYDVGLLGLALNDALARRDLSAARGAADRLSRMRPDDQEVRDLSTRLERAPRQP